MRRAACTSSIKRRFGLPAALLTWLGLGLGAVLAAGTPVAAAPAGRDLSIQAGAVFDSVRGEVLAGRRIVIHGGRIVEVRPAHDDDPPPDLDWRDRLVMPGWFDMHTHLIGDIQSADPLAPLKSSAAEDVLLGAAHAAATLRAGFTSVRDVGTYRGLVDVALRDAIRRGEVAGPRMFVAGAYVTAPGGGGEVTGTPGASLPAEFRLGVARGEEALRERVRVLAQGGVDLIKVIATGAVLTEGTEPGAMEFSEDELRAIVDEARKHGLDVTAHAHGAEGIKAAIRAGVRSIEHASLIDDEGLALAKRHGVFLAMDVYNGDYIDEVGKRDGWSADILRKNRDTTDAQREGFRKAVAAGVTVVFATDAGVFPHGTNARQFAYMIRHGMRWQQAVQSATWHAARLLRVEQELGSIEPGKLADLVALPLPADGDPPDFEAAVRVVQEGVRVEGPAVTPPLSAVRRRAPEEPVTPP
ncbi:MAG: amidohydrolase family protein [Xanthomonadales bacterium]|nr:amidohydrolase family protein [Xanthomonadales bacterium]